MKTLHLLVSTVTFLGVSLSNCLAQTAPSDPGSSCRVCGTIVFVDPEGHGTIFHNKVVVAIGKDIELQPNKTKNRYKPLLLKPEDILACTNGSCVSPTKRMAANNQMQVFLLPAGSVSNATILKENSRSRISP